jgi:hypothetical protein
MGFSRFKMHHYRLSRMASLFVIPVEYSFGENLSQLGGKS